MKKKKIKIAEGPSIIENYKVDKHNDIVWTHRISAGVIDSPAYVRGPPKYIPPHDAFLAYIEWKASKPFYKRWFLPL